MSFRATFFSRVKCAGRPGVAVALILLASPLHAGPAIETQVVADDAPVADSQPPGPANSEVFPVRAKVRALIEQETAKTELPPDIAEAVVFAESRYDPSVIGKVGEIGLMQVRPETAAMLGFKGTTSELARLEINIHYGVIYLAQAWHLARGDLCRALMKYRAGHGEEDMTPRSVIYCNRARNWLLAKNSPFAVPGAVAAATANPTRAAPATKSLIRPMDVYAVYKQGTAAASRAFWAAHEARIRAIKEKIEAKWRRVASR